MKILLPCDMSACSEEAARQAMELVHEPKGPAGKYVSVSMNVCVSG